MASTSPRGWNSWLSPAACYSPARPTTSCKASSTFRWSSSANSMSRTSRGQSGPTGSGLTGAGQDGGAGFAGRAAAPWAAAVPLVLMLAGGVWYFWPQQLGLVSRATLAVLPFANIPGDEATGRLADRLTEEIITDLSRYREMDVIARNSTEVYKDKPVDL